MASPRIINMHFMTGQRERILELKSTSESDTVCEQIADLLTRTEYLAWWNTTPDDNAGFLEAARAKLADLRRSEQENTAAECERINRWLSDHWDEIPPVEF